MRATRLIFLGPPGTGKGTQAQRLQERFGFVALSSGDVLRREIREESAIGRIAKQYVEKGTLVPDDVITGVMLAAVDRLSKTNGFILDGFPRTVPQAESLEAGLRDRELSIDLAIDFQLPDAEIVARIGGRRVCKDCAYTYNARFKPPRIDGRCDNCGGELVQRADDREDVIRTRLATYRAQSAPLIDYYEERGLLRRVDAADAIDSVEAAVLQFVESPGRRA